MRTPLGKIVLLVAFVVIGVVRPVTAQTAYPCKISATNPKCMTVGPQTAPQGWIVGEVRPFVVGDASKDFIDQMAKQGWVECRGQSAIRKDFDELWKISGTSWGSADKTNVFFLPDLRGLFLRAWNHSKSILPDYPNSPYDGEPGDLKLIRVAPRPEAKDTGDVGSTGDYVGSLESDQVGSHSHTFRYTTKKGAFQRLSDENNQRFWYDESTATGQTDMMPQAETRTENAYVMYFIYVGKPAQAIEAKTDAEKQDPLKRTGQIACYKDSQKKCKFKL